MTKTPPSIHTDYYGREKEYHWQALDPDKADMGATWGLRGPKGTTFLLLPCTLYPDWSHHIQAVGLWSGLYDMERNIGLEGVAKEIESIAKCAPGMIGADRFIKPVEYKSWLLEKEEEA